MSLIKKSDLKNHLSTRTGATTLPVQPVSQPDATGYSGDGSEDGVAGAVADSTHPLDFTGEGKDGTPVLKQGDGR